MQTLIIHPQDPTTDFLWPIYDTIKNKRVIRGGITKKELLKEVSSYQRIMMMGHGSPMGLFAVGQFEQESYMSHIIDQSFVSALQNKDNLFIWCNANQFVEKHQLSGFYSGMFISEVAEAALYEFDVSKKTINHSNQSFSEIVSTHINETAETLHNKVIAEYGALSNYNPIVKYNNERLRYQSLCTVHQQH